MLYTYKNDQPPNLFIYAYQLTNALSICISTHERPFYMHINSRTPFLYAYQLTNALSICNTSGRMSITIRLNWLAAHRAYMCQQQSELEHSTTRSADSRVESWHIFIILFSESVVITM